jgi:hypothetical protein
MADQRVDEPDEPQAETPALHDQPGENEERDGEKNEIAGTLHHGLRQHHERGSVRCPEIRRRRQQQNEAHRRTGEDRDEEQGKRHDDGGVATEPGEPKIAGHGCS